MTMFVISGYVIFNNPISVDLTGQALAKSKKKAKCVLLSMGNPKSFNKKDTEVFIIQSTLVISTSVIANNRLSRRKNLVLVITQKSKIRL